ncbi:C-type lectin domain family 4 member C-like [Saccostrea cucullata]|uniref:C-type lectin domain family 4 member C-like n=1 Tax=Saccostrea cuccullata TaxID=36930 RepID=UPI002ED24FC1
MSADSKDSKRNEQHKITLSSKENMNEDYVEIQDEYPRPAFVALQDWKDRPYESLKREEIGRYDMLRQNHEKSNHKERNCVVVGDETEKHKKPSVSIKTIIVIITSICLIGGFVTMASFFAVKQNSNYGNTIIVQEDQRKNIELNQSLQQQTSRLRSIIETPHTWSSNGKSIYILFQRRMTWIQSQDWCSGIGGKLAEVETEEENNFIVNNSLSVTNTIGGVWAGGTDIETEGVWKWASTNTNITFFAWTDGEPNNLLQLENCLELGSAWNDVYCENRRRFLCEFLQS